MTVKRPARAKALSPAYAKRIAAAMAKGRTRQQARGHRPGEARERAAREAEEYGLSSYQVRSIRSWVEHSFNPGETKELDPEDIIEQARSEGYEWFVNYREVWWSARRTYIRENKAGVYASRGEGYLGVLAGMAGVEDISWVYYH